MKVTLTESLIGFSVWLASNNTLFSIPYGNVSKIKALPEENVMMNYLQVVEMIIICLHCSLAEIW